MPIDEDAEPMKAGWLIDEANFVPRKGTNYESHFTATGDEVIKLCNKRDKTNIKFKFQAP